MNTFKQKLTQLFTLTFLLLSSSAAYTQSTVTEDFESGDFSAMNWQFSGTPNSWEIENVSVDSGFYSASANHIAFNDEVTMSVVKTFTAPSTITFMLKQTEDNVFTIASDASSGFVYPGWLSTGDWELISYDVPAGTQTISFSSYNMGVFGEPFTMRDSLFIDNIHFPNQPYTENAYVQLVHNSSDPAAAVVDVYVNNVLAIDNFTFRTATPYIELPAGSAFEVSLKGPDSTPDDPALWQNTYTLEAGNTYQLIAEGLIGDAGGFDPYIPFDIAVYPGARQSANVNGNTDILVHHGATDAPTVDVAIDGTTVVDNASYGDFAGYFELASANVTVSLMDETGSTLIGSYFTPLADSGFANTTITLLASGFVNPSSNSNGAPFGLYAVPVAGGDLFKLPLLTENLEGAVENFETGDFSMLNWGFEGTEGAWHIVSDDETGTLAATATHQDFNEYQTMYVNGIFSQAGEILVDVKQTSDASILIVSSNDDGIYTISADNEWYTIAISVEAGYNRISFTSYLIGVFGEVFETQTDSVLIDNIRFGDAPPMMANVQFINNMADFQFPSLDVLMNGSLMMDNMTYGTTSPFVQLPANTNTMFAVTTDENPTPMMARSFVFEPGKTYVLVLEGLMTESGYNPYIPADIYIYEMTATDTPSDKVGVIFHNGVTDAPAVELTETSTGNRKVASGMSFGDFSDYEELPISDYYYEVRDTYTNELLATFPLPLTGMDVAGQTITVMLTGFMNPEQNNGGAPMSVMFTTEEGGSMTQVDGITSIAVLNENDVKLYPNPVSSTLSLEIGDDTAVVGLNIFSMNGAQVEAIDLADRLNGTLRQIQMDVQRFKPGMYFMQIETSRGVINKKFTVVR